MSESAESDPQRSGSNLAEGDTMGTLDWVVIAGYFLVMVWIGWWSKRRIKNASDFFVAGGKVPWWLVGISHHMSGYSAAVFVGYAALAYTTGFAVYVWWALSITAACVIGTIFFAPAGRACGSGWASSRCWSTWRPASTWPPSSCSPGPARC